MSSRVPFGWVCAIVIGVTAFVPGCGGKSGGAPGTGGSGATGGGGGSRGGSGGGGGSAVGDAGQDLSTGGHGCGPTPTPHSYTPQKLFNMTGGEGRAFPVPRGVPMPIAVYKGTSTSGSSRIVGSTLPLVEGDGGASLTTYNATPLAQAETFSPPDLRFTGAGAPRIVYLASSVTGYKVRYAEWSGDLTQTPADVVVGTDTAAVAATSIPVIALDASDRAFVAYFGNDSTLRLATRAGTGWTVETVMSNVIVPNTEIALAVDAGGQPYLFVTGLGSAAAGAPGPVGLSVLTRGASGWSSLSLHGDAADETPRAARAPSGEVEVLFASRSAISRAVLRGGAWQVEAPLGGITKVVDSGGFDVAVGPGDVVHIAAGKPNAVVHLAYNGCEWLEETVDPTLGQSSGYGIALDAAGNAHIAYQRSASGPVGPTHEIWYASPQP